MISVEEAARLVLAAVTDYGTMPVYFEQAAGRILAEPIVADRDIPPFHRASMDGIAITYHAFEKGVRHFKIKAIQAAGCPPLSINGDDECMEIMTGAALSPSVDTVIRYEDLEMKDGVAIIIIEKLAQGQNVHHKGKDKKEGAVLVPASTIIDAAAISIAAATGSSELIVKKPPKIMVISTGDELVAPHEKPLPHQLRASNVFAIKTLLHQFAIEPGQLHLPDDREKMKQELDYCLQQYDVVLISGAVSAGKFDYLPQVLEECGVSKIFHKVAQRPGKPFWFGKNKEGVLVFAFPGNPVSTFLCMIRYFLPWLNASLGIENRQGYFATLKKDVHFSPPLQYFLPVKIIATEKAQLIATPIEGNGSGDYLQLLEATAFIELPAGRESFNKGEVFRIWPYRNVFL